MCFHTGYVIENGVKSAPILHPTPNPTPYPTPEIAFIYYPFLYVV